MVCQLAPGGCTETRQAVRTPLDVQLGQLLIQEGLITNEQLSAALVEQRNAPRYVPVGQILVQRQLITQKQLSMVVDQNQKRPRLGELLVRNGSITEAQLQLALQRHAQLRRPLGEVLVKSGWSPTT